MAIFQGGSNGEAISWQDERLKSLDVSGELLEYINTVLIQTIADGIKNGQDMTNVVADIEVSRLYVANLWNLRTAIAQQPGDSDKDPNTEATLIMESIVLGCVAVCLSKES